MQIRVGLDTTKLQRELEKEADRFARAGARVVNELALRSQIAIVDGMRAVFDRPTRWTLRSTRVIKADVYAGPGERVEAVVDFKDGATLAQIQGEARRYLRPQIEGGGRKLKRFEVLLREAGILPAGLVAVPAKFTELDSYGNFKRAALVKILSDLRAFQESGFTANRSADRPSRGVRRNERYFAIRGFVNSVRLRPGIYLRGRPGKPPQMVIAFVKAPAYPVRFRPAEVARAVVELAAPQVWVQALNRQLPQR